MFAKREVRRAVLQLIEGDSSWSHRGHSVGSLHRVRGHRRGHGDHGGGFENHVLVLLHDTFLLAAFLAQGAVLVRRDAVVDTQDELDKIEDPIAV